MSGKGKSRSDSIHQCVSDTETAFVRQSSKKSDYGGVRSTSYTLPDTHCHVDDGGDEEDSKLNAKARRKLIIACCICFVFMIIEVVGGILANSLAIATDAAHLLTDFASFMISLFALWLATRPATKRMSFGWYRAEVVGALASVLMIWLVTGILVYMAVLRCLDVDSFEIDALIMLITSGLGVLVNIIMGVNLHDAGHLHSHGGEAAPLIKQKKHSSHSHNGSHSDDEEANHQHSHTNINVRAAFIHVIGDFIQSIGVFIAALVIYFKPEWKIADPICTFLFSILVLFTTFNILKDTMNVLMEGTPRSLKYTEVRKALLGINSVKEVHNLRIWSLTMSKAAVSVHIAIDKESCHKGHHEVLKDASALLKEKFGIQEITIQIEDYVNEMDDCDQCHELKD